MNGCESQRSFSHFFPFLSGSDGVLPVSRFLEPDGGHTFKWVNANGEWKYVQIHMISDQGIKTYTGPEAAKMDGVNPDSAGQDLVEAIARGENPSWLVSEASKCCSSSVTVTDQLPFVF